MIKQGGKRKKRKKKRKKEERKRRKESDEAWISQYDIGKFLIFDVDTINFAENAHDLGMVIETINAELHGLFKQ